jgi:hypothetical protein
LGRDTADLLPISIDKRYGVCRYFCWQLNVEQIRMRLFLVDEKSSERIVETEAYLCLTQTDRLILLTLADHVSGLRIEDVARVTGSKFRWGAREISKLAQMGILHRVAPGTYALSEEAEPQP